LIRQVASSAGQVLDDFVGQIEGVERDLVDLDGAGEVLTVGPGTRFPPPSPARARGLRALLQGGRCWLPICAHGRIMRSMRRVALTILAALAPACGHPAATPAPDVAAVVRWATVHQETFEHGEIGDVAARVDEVPDDGPFADNGVYFRKRGVVPPAAFRTTAPFGEGGWLVVEGYSRSPGTRLRDLAAVVPDPAGGPNRVLRLASPVHTDAVVVRPAQPLPDRYRVSLRVGYASFGDGIPGGKNGYRGGERTEPWVDWDATSQNGFYWLAILDALPRPHNNTWIHHHRKVVIDSDNHFPPWMEIFDGQRFVKSGASPIMMFALDGRGPDKARSGRPFLSYSAGVWQPSGEIRAVDAYRPDRWYEVSIERDRRCFTLEIAGDFRHGGARRYRARIDAAASCLFHYNRTADELDPRCADETSLPELSAGFPGWPRGSAYPDWFFFGDPHTNFYTGQVFYDDVRLEIPAE
jgi:hypothetical protein